MAKIDNGAGDHLIMLFSVEGSIIKGFDHESQLSPYAQDEHKVWPGIYDNVPSELLSHLEHSVGRVGIFQRILKLAVM
ncbi:hypothetical protein [Paenibacillus azoreducens]|uniref:Uncharacterized protein n=2 Tax=Paenibacillus azoreducens TaxID=116718 RepID=A0A919YCQ9_9BACL|nr:hypothetical protein [Paenibacillus azoreducens]GIO48812.1 hypothetical protein J34TS1_35770 [Paenibacillus azoreducens]